MNMFAPGWRRLRLRDRPPARCVDGPAGRDRRLASGTTTLDLAGVPAASHQALTAAFDLRRTRSGDAAGQLAHGHLRQRSPPPLPPSLCSFLATPKTIVFGQTAILSGNADTGGVPLSGPAGGARAQPVGTRRSPPLPPAMTDGAGNYSALVKPTKKTTYKAAFGGFSPEPTAVVLVKHKLTLKGRRRSGKVYLNGTVGPKHVRRVVLVQRKMAALGDDRPRQDDEALDVQGRAQSAREEGSVPREDRRATRSTSRTPARPSAPSRQSSRSSRTSPKSTPSAHSPWRQ